MNETNIKESVWTAVRLGKKDTAGYAISKQAVSNTWYRNYLDNSGGRFNRLLKYDEADNTSVEISRALDILSEDISSCNADDNYMFTDTYPEDSKVKKTTSRLISDAIRMWARRTEFEGKLFTRIRDTLKYGATFYLRNPDGSLKDLKTERMVGYILSDNDENEVTHYIYNPKGRMIRTTGTLTNNQSEVTTSSNQIDSLIPIPISDLVVLKTNHEPFGRSIIENVYRTWRQMSLIEDAVIIYRVVRAPERRVYYIDTGNLQGPKREAAIERQRIRLMQKNAVKRNELTAEYDPHSTSEDIFIPTNSTGKGSRIETLPGGQTLGELADLEYFSRQLSAGLRIPHSMIDTHGDQQQQYSDMRVGQMYQIEMRYMGYVKRFQKLFGDVLFSDFKEFATERDIVVPDDLEFGIAEPMSFAAYKELELNQTQLNVYNSTLSITTLSKKFAMQKYLGLDTDDMRYNEEARLREMGISDEVIKKMEQSEIDTVVYGQISEAISQKYNIQIPEESHRF